MTDANTAAIFTAALTGHLTRTNLGRQVEVTVGGDTYRAMIPERHRAYVDASWGPGGTEFLHINATPEQDSRLRKAHGVAA